MYPENYWRKFIGIRFASKYLIREFLGSGAFGAVFKADEMLDGHLMQSVALKLMLVNPEIHQQQVRELQLAIRLKHPNLINGLTYERGEVLGDEFFGLVMEVGAESLADYLQANGNPGLEPETVITIIQQVAEGLAFLHDQEIVHRDLNPNNILRVGDRWKITDFGIARVLSRGTSTRTSARNHVGTLAYTAPEAYEGIISPAGDVWSFGVITCELLTGQNPFRAESIPELMRLILTNNIQWIDSTEKPFADIIKACLIRPRQNRCLISQIMNTIHSFRNQQNAYSDSPDDLLRLGECFFEHKEYEKAIYCFNKILETENYNFRAWASLAKVFCELGESNKASICSYNSYCYQGNFLISSEKYEEALVVFEQAFKITPNYSKALFGMGKCLFKLNKNEQALFCFVDAWCNEGNFLYSQEKYEEGLEAFTKALEINPDYIRALFGVGDCLIKINRSEEAFFYFIVAWCNEGDFFYKQEKYQEALDAFTKALGINPDYPRALFGVGNCFIKINRSDEASLYFMEGWCNAGNSLYNQERYQEALSLFNQVLGINPDNTRALFGIANCLVKLNRNEESSVYFINGLCSRGDSLLKEEKYEEALDAFSQALEIDPDSSRALLGLDTILNKSKKRYSVDDVFWDWNSRNSINGKINWDSLPSEDHKQELKSLLYDDWTEVFYSEDIDDPKNNTRELKKHQNKTEFINENFSEYNDNMSNVVVLNVCQLEALERIKKFLFSNNSFFRLTGYAGTGKSFLISQLIEDLRKKDGYHFCLAGPTHKSVKNLKSLIAGDIEIQTLARLLGKRPEINYEDGQEVFIQVNEVDLSKFDLVIVDEFSMINRDDFQDLINESNRHRFKIIFVGDAAQLPPVGEEYPIVASYPEIKDHAELTEVVRYDKAIAEVAEEIRSNNQYKQQLYRFQTSEDQSIIVLPQQAWLETAIQHFTNGWSKRPDSARIICWRNKTVADFNQQIRRAIHGNDVSPYIPGDLLICRKPLFRKQANSEEWQRYADNRSEFLVMEEPKLIELENLIQYYLILAQGEDNSEYYLKVLTPESAEQFEREQQQIKQQANAAKNAGQKYKHLWVKYYDRMKWFDDIAHAMSITTHSAQGSSLDTVFLYAHEMRWCKEKQQILYTALTRARKKVYVCQNF